MMISTSAACRRYLDRSSLTSANATSFGPLRFRRPLFLEPSLRFGLCDDGEDFDLRFCNVIEHPNVAVSQPILRLDQAAKAFDPTLARFRRFVAQMHLQRLDHPDAHRH